jgi:SpoVK/Ycf46/Vps4 family AAA+-type ATPase
MSEMVMPEISWADVIGLKPQKERFLNDLIIPAQNEQLSSIKNTWMVYGPPGTGKTVLGKAVAYEIGLTFLYVDCANFWNIDMWFEDAEKILKAIFSKAKEYKPCVVTIDSFDCMFRY